MKKATIIFYKDWLPLIESLAPDLQLKFWGLWCRYDGTEYAPVIENAHLRGVFDFVISQVKKSDAKYIEVLEKRSNAGKISGLNRRNKKEQKGTHVQSVEQTELNDNENDNVNDIIYIPEKIQGDIDSQKTESPPPPAPKKKRTPKPKREPGEFYEEGKKFASWFEKNMVKEGMTYQPKDLEKWALEYDLLRGKHGKTQIEIISAVKFARNDKFWKGAFLTPMKLRRPDPEGVMYIDVFLQRIKTDEEKLAAAQPPAPVYRPAPNYNPATGI